MSSLSINDEVKAVIKKLQEKINQTSFQAEGFDIGAIDYWLHHSDNIFEYGEDFINYWSLRLGEIFVNKLTVKCSDFNADASWCKPYQDRYYVSANGLLIDPKALLIMESSSNIQVKEGTFDSIFFNFIYVYKFSLYPFINPLIDLTETYDDDYLVRWEHYPPDFIVDRIRELDSKSDEWQRHLSLDTYQWFNEKNWDKIYAHIL